MSNQNKNSAFQMIADIEGDIRDIINVNTPDNVPILPVRNLVLFPGVVSPILIGRDSSKIVIQKAEKKGELIGIICQRDPEVDVPLQEDLYKTGVFAKVTILPPYNFCFISLSLIASVSSSYDTLNFLFIGLLC